MRIAIVTDRVAKPVGPFSAGIRGPTAVAVAALPLGALVEIEVAATVGRAARVAT